MCTALLETQPGALQTSLALRSVEGQEGATERNQHAQRPWGTNQHFTDLLCGNRDLSLKSSPQWSL